MKSLNAQQTKINSKQGELHTLRHTHTPVHIPFLFLSLCLCLCIVGPVDFLAYKSSDRTNPGLIV